MITQLPDNSDLFRSLMSALCPACGGNKNRAQTFCSRCYLKLPQAQRRTLYGRIDTGKYHPARLAILEAINMLGADEFKLPAA